MDAQPVPRTLSLNTSHLRATAASLAECTQLQQHHSELAADRVRDRARVDAQRQDEQERVNERLKSASRRQSAGGVGIERERERRARRRQSAGDVGSEQQATAADALQQQVDEYLASFDPEKSFYQDGWAMGEMQENFQQKLRSMRNLCCVVCLERWYTDEEWSDPALCV